MLILLLDMLESLIRPDASLGPLRVLTYITVRAVLSLIMAFAISLALGPWLIRRLRALNANQAIRTSKGKTAIDFATMHGHKGNTPTMGGLLILAALLIPVLLFCRLTSGYIVLLLAMTVGYALLGFRDDYLKVVEKNHRGVSARGKLIVQASLGLLLGLSLYYGEWNVRYSPVPGVDGYPYLLFPFFKFLYPAWGLLFIPFVMIVLMAASNAVNLTDGLDGLAIGVSTVNIGAFMLVAYLVARPDFADYLFVPYIAGGGEIVVFLSALLGASLGFLWFNSHPAQIFMGDTGSLMLGGVLGTTAILLKQEMLLIVIGGIFVIEALSVIMQVACFKLTGTRIFRMAPLHHHFERAGLHESKIIIRFWLCSLLLALAGLALLKLR